MLETVNRPDEADVSADPLASILVKRRILTAEAARKHLADAAIAGRFLEEELADAKVLSERQLLEVLENQYFCPAAALADAPFEPEALSLVPRQVAERYLFVPVGIAENTIKIVFANPDDGAAKTAAQQASAKQVAGSVGLRHQIFAAIGRLYGRFEQEVRASEARPPDEPAVPEDASAEDDEAMDGPRLEIRFDQRDAVRAVDSLLIAASRAGTTDVHFEPTAADLGVRFRVDGVLHCVARLPHGFIGPLVSRIKVLAGMDIAEKRAPQDGRYSIENEEIMVDLRVSSLPSQFGETVVIRLLQKEATLKDLDNLQMPTEIREAVGEMVEVPRGLFLVTGPTGSGKTTTLYASLGAVDREAVKVITLEDPIEYSVPNITQVQIHEQAGLTFPAGLAAILRQDPDVILVGEIRDLKTVTVAARAALTGHKVFSTLHTNDACQAVTRLVDMGVEPHLIAATLRGVLAQRLIRLTCDECRVAHEPTDSELALLGYPKIDRLTHGEGCSECGYSGYRGRLAIFEYFRVDEVIQRLILERASVHALRHAARRAGMTSMAEYARQAVLGELTSVAEVQRTIFAGEDRETLCEGCQRAVSVEFSICPFCQHVLKDCCPDCKCAVEAYWEACPSCGSELEREWERVYCTQCVAPISSDASTCPYCGGAQ